MSDQQYTMLATLLLVTLAETYQEQGLLEAEIITRLEGMAQQLMDDFHGPRTFFTDKMTAFWSDGSESPVGKLPQRIKPIERQTVALSPCTMQSKAHHFCRNKRRAGARFLAEMASKRNDQLNDEISLYKETRRQVQHDEDPKEK